MYRVRMGPRFRVVAFISALVAVGLTAASAHPDTPVGYLARAGWGQAGLLWSRVSLDRVLQDEALSRDQRGRIHLVRDVKSWGGDRAGLQHTHRNYETLAAGWDHTIWNVSACEELSFEPTSTWFPIVGRVPYLGYFNEDQADRYVRRMTRRGLDVHKRTAGAYSTLGWFKDPILPGMLRWPEDRLIETVLHELAHTTLWLPGSVKFNESFASFFGEAAMLQYLADRYGAHSERVSAAEHRLEDERLFRVLMHQVAGELEALYSADLPDSIKRERKAELLDELPTRAGELPFADDEWLASRIRPGDWNNARLVQFRVYNDAREGFAALLAEEDGDLGAFLARIEALVSRSADPATAIREAGDR